MSTKRHRVCPVELAGALDNRIRRWIQDPRKIVEPYVKEGMTVLDFGCGPGFFTVEIARLAGASGRVIAADVQAGMLQKLQNKLQGTGFEQRVTLHKCEEYRIGVRENVDWVLAFYVVHEVPDQEALFRELRSILNPHGQVLIVEPPFHVSKAAFEETLRKARLAGLVPVGRPKVLLGKAVVLQDGATAEGA